MTIRTKQSNKRTNSIRSGSTYFLVVSVSMIVSVIAMGAMAISASLRRKSELETDYASAGTLAQSAVDLALSELASRPDWRSEFSNFENGTFTNPLTIGNGDVSFSFLDPLDSQINSGNSHVVEILGKGRLQRSTRIFSVWAIPQGRPLDVLRMAAHSNGDLTIDKELVAGGGPVSSNSAINITSAYMIGNAEANSIDSPNNINGYKSIGQSARTMPSSLLFQIYRTMASEISYADLPVQNELKDDYICRGRNPTTAWPTNSNGIYRIVVPPETTFTIRNCYIEGTLLVHLSGDNSRLSISDGVVWKPFSPKFPSLIVNASSDIGTRVKIKCKGSLDPSRIATTPSLPASIGAQPASLNGLFHVIRNYANPQTLTELSAIERLTGTVVVDGLLRIKDHSQLVSDPLLVSQPPLGYTNSIQPGQLITNGSMSEGLMMWMIHNSNEQATGAMLEVVPSSISTDLNCLRISNRKSASAGVYQDLTSCLKSGETYNFTAYVEMESNDENVQVILAIRTETDGLVYQTYSQTAMTTGTTIAFTLNPSWTGDLQFARLIFTTSTSTQPFRIDNVSLPDPNGRSASPMRLFPTTWKVNQNRN